MGEASPFERMEWLVGLVTFGLNLPLFTFAYDPVEAIAFPGGGLPPDEADKARWLNYYDKDDVLGYPLKPISPTYNAIVNEDNDFTRPVAHFLADFL